MNNYSSRDLRGLDEHLLKLQLENLNNKSKMTQVRAKFKVNAVTKTAGWQSDKPFIYDVQAFPVTSNSEENKIFYASTPSGEIKMGGLSEAVASLFEPGKEYYVTFEKSE